jgi:para-nitrobenzyl esterase
MVTVKLAQGSYRGVEKDGVHRFHAIPYASPFQRFKSPSKITHQPSSIEPQVASVLGPNCPQRPTRLEFVIGPLPFNAGPQDEAHCGVLSVYRPANSDEKLPTIVFLHGGAFVSGGSQIPWYDGSRLARDGNVIVISISYRLGAFGFLYSEDRSSKSDKLPYGLEDVILGFEWVRDNIHSFGGDPANITASGHSSGGYTVQSLLDLRPDLFNRVIIQSSPAGIVLTPTDARSVRKVFEDSLPQGKTVETASAQEILEAQAKAIRSHPKLFMAFMPWTRNKTPPGYECSKKKDILIGWTKHDGSCFAALGLTATGLPPWMANPMAYDMSKSLTRSIFSGPSKRLAAALHTQGHSVTTYEAEWGPEGFELGVTHTTDLPLLLGDEEAWINAPMLGCVSWAEWERRGKPFREAWGRFARDGSPPSPFIDGLIVNGAM